MALCLLVAAFRAVCVALWLLVRVRPVYRLALRRFRLALVAPSTLKISLWPVSVAACFRRPVRFFLPLLAAWLELCAVALPLLRLYRKALLSFLVALCAPVVV